MPDNWLKNAIKKANQMILLFLGAKNWVPLGFDDVGWLLLMIAITASSGLSTPISANIFFALGKSFLLVINQRGLSGTPITINR